MRLLIACESEVGAVEVMLVEVASARGGSMERQKSEARLAASDGMIESSGLEWTSAMACVRVIEVTCTKRVCSRCTICVRKWSNVGCGIVRIWLVMRGVVKDVSVEVHVDTGARGGLEGVVDVMVKDWVVTVMMMVLVVAQERGGPVS